MGWKLFFPDYLTVFSQIFPIIISFGKLENQILQILFLLPLLGIYVLSEAPCTRVFAPTFEIPARALSVIQTVKVTSKVDWKQRSYDTKNFY